MGAGEPGKAILSGCRRYGGGDRESRKVLPLAKLKG
jgi:hypothetical protein